MKRFFGMFVLTPGEQRLVLFVVLALVFGVVIKHYRETSLNDLPQPGVEPLLMPLVSPTPKEQ